MKQINSIFVKGIDGVKFDDGKVGIGDIAVVGVESDAEPGFFTTSSGVGCIQYSKHQAEVHNYIFGHDAETHEDGYFTYPVEYVPLRGKSVIKQVGGMLSQYEVGIA